MLGFYPSSPAKAEISYGLDAIGYIIDQIPPTQSDSLYPTCGYELENNINRNFDGEPFAQCPNDYFMVHYSGYITLPQHQTIEFMIAADDGGTININGSQFGDWNDKGCSWYESGALDLPSEQSLPLDGWFYENGGGTCYMMAWNIDGLGWEIIPDSAFTTQLVVTTTTSTTTTSTTTTVAPTTTTTEPPTTTTQPVRTTTTTEPVVVEEPTTTTTTTSTTSTSLVPPVVVQTTTSLPTTTTELTTTSSSSTTIPPTEEPAPQVEPEVTALLGALNTLSQSEIASVVTDILDKGVSSEEATALATNPEVLQAVTADEAKEIFDAVQVSELSDAQAEQLVEAVQGASEEVRAAFEDKINVFGGKFNKYVPVGSKINVGQRKVLIAATGVLFMAPTVSVSSSTSGSPSGESKSRRKK